MLCLRSGLKYNHLFVTWQTLKLLVMSNEQFGVNLNEKKSNAR